MKVSNVTKEDGMACAHLLNVIKVARFDNLTGEDIERLMQAKRWLFGVANEMATQLKGTAPKSDGGMKVKQIGSLGPLKARKAKKKR